MSYDPLLTLNKVITPRFDPNSLFDKRFIQQKNFCEDPAKLKALFCTRRAAKSYTDGLYAVQEAQKHPGCNVLLVGLTRDSAKGIFWKDILRVIDRKHKLNATFHKVELTMTLPNGSVIAITGIDADEEEMNKVLGRKYRLAVIDEGSMYSIDMRNFIYGILKPAMVNTDDLAEERGTIVLSGTASNRPRGLFFDITTGKEPGWSLHQWSALDNPFVARSWQEELDDIKANRPLYMETPQFKQWYLNQWVIDETKLVYKYNENKNRFQNLPYPGSRSWTFNLGVDLGWEDDNAFVLAGYHQNDPTLYIIKCFKQNKMTFPEVEAKIREFMSDPAYPIQSVIIDGANKQGVESMNMRSDINFVYADKQGKSDHIEICNGDMIQAKLKIHESCAPLVDEMLTLVWRTDGDVIKIPRVENPSCPNHLCDAFLYVWFHCYHFLAQPAEVIPLPGTPEYIRQQENLHKQAILDKIQRDQALKDANGQTWVKDKFGRDPWHNWNE